MTIKVGEANQPARVATNFDLSAHLTSPSVGLTMKFIPPASGGTEFTVTNLSTPDVTAPAVPLVNDPELGNRAASTYFQWLTDDTSFDAPGDWTACCLYDDGINTREANQTIFPIGASCF